MNNKDIGIVGAGNMGQAIAWAMQVLGHNLTILDQSEDSIRKCQKIIGFDAHKFVCGGSYILVDKCDAIISSLPYHQNYKLAQFCIDNGIAYFDLGGSVGTSEKINSYAKGRATRPVLTDLGLAPGWVNIIAEHMVDEFLESTGRVPESVRMMVGGLPQTPSNTLKYTCTWSYDGLINEYKDNCIILVNGFQDVVRGMDGYEFPIDSQIGPLEGFYTSGGAAHTVASLQRKGIQNCSYKTLRYRGHRDLVNFLIHESKMSDETVTEVFKRTCPPQDDLVIIKVLVEDVEFEHIIKSDKTFSAMQKATAFPIAAAAHSVLSDASSGHLLKYDDLGIEEFNKPLDLLFEAAE